MRLILVLSFSLAVSALAVPHAEVPGGPEMPSSNPTFDAKLLTQLSDWRKTNETSLKNFGTLKEKEQKDLSLELRYFLPPDILKRAAIRTRIIPVEGRGDNGGYFLILMENAARAGDDYGYFIFEASTMKTSMLVDIPNSKSLKMKSGTLAIVSDPKRNPVQLYFGIKKYTVVSDAKNLDNLRVKDEKGEIFEVKRDEKSKLWGDPTALPR